MHKISSKLVAAIVGVVAVGLDILSSFAPVLSKVSTQPSYLWTMNIWGIASIYAQFWGGSLLGSTNYSKIFSKSFPPIGILPLCGCAVVAGTIFFAIGAGFTSRLGTRVKGLSLLGSSLVLLGMVAFLVIFSDWNTCNAYVSGVGFGEFL
jgi:hypothetical protein